MNVFSYVEGIYNDEGIEVNSNIFLSILTNLLYIRDLAGIRNLICIDIKRVWVSVNEENSGNVDRTTVKENVLIGYSVVFYYMNVKAKVEISKREITKEEKEGLFSV